MTWKTLGGLLAALLLLSACALPGSGKSPTTPSVSTPSPVAGQHFAGQHCADLFAAAITAPSAPIAGAYACQDATLITIAQGSGIKTDADLWAAASRWGYMAAVRLGGNATVFSYLLSGPGVQPVVLLVWMSPDGLVDGFQRVRHP